MPSNLSHFPTWLKRPLPSKGEIGKLKSRFRSAGLHTVCESARCPNIGECFSKKTATFMINGNVCTRVCRFCDVKSGRPLAQNPEEPQAVAESAASLGLKYVVVTAVNRDDLKDGGAGQFILVAQALREKIEGVEVEFLIPDFMGMEAPLRQILECAPEVLNHNLETVRRLTPEVRNKAKYDRSLELLGRAKRWGTSKVKTGVMLGLGETREDLIGLFDDVAASQCDILTLGQYLRPSAEHLEVSRFVPPSEFDELRSLARAAGIPTVFAGPFVRSSYHAGEISRGLEVKAS